jgi:hypothetical protein
MARRQESETDRGAYLLECRLNCAPVTRAVAGIGEVAERRPGAVQRLEAKNGNKND